MLRTMLVLTLGSYAAAFVGIGYYPTHDLKAAARYLQRALQPAPPNSQGGPLLDLLLGNVANQRGMPSAATRYYEVAAHDHVMAPRAKVGLAQVAYQIAKGNCDKQTTHPGGLLHARQLLSAITAAQLSDTDVAARVAFGLGQVDLCLSAAEAAPRWTPARQEFTTVVQAYRPELPELRDEAAESHAGIGLIDLLTSKGLDGYAGARAEYTRAAQTTTLAGRRSFFEQMVGYIDERLRDFTGAARAYRRAADGAPDAKSRSRLAIAAARASTRH